MVVLLLRRAACRGHWCTEDGANAAFSTAGSRTCFLPSRSWRAHTAQREPARTPFPLRTPPGGRRLEVVDEYESELERAQHGARSAGAASPAPAVLSGVDRRVGPCRSASSTWTTQA